MKTLGSEIRRAGKPCDLCRNRQDRKSFQMVMTGDQAKQKPWSFLPASSQTPLTQILKAEPQFSQLGARDTGCLQCLCWAGPLVCYEQQTYCTPLLPTPQPPCPSERYPSQRPSTPAASMVDTGRVVRPDIQSKQCLMSALHLLN